MRALCGETLVPTARLAIARSAVLPDPAAVEPSLAWRLPGVSSHVRYVERPEKHALVSRQEGLGRPRATHAALIPISKSQAWWEMTQEERRAVFETRSRHIADSLKYLPAIARQLYHCRDLGASFDFLTWFEWAPEHDAEFDALLAQLRAAEEWAHVTREVEIRLIRAG